MSLTRSIAATAGVGVAALAVVGAGSVVAPQRATQPPVDVASAITRVCPVVDTALAPSTLRLAAGDGRVSAREVKPDASPTTAQPGGIVTMDRPSTLVRTDVDAGARGGASTLTNQGEGLERGLAGSSCASPASTVWFPSVQSSKSAQTTLYLSSIDDAGAVVDLAFFGSSGRMDVPGVRSISVKPHSTQTVVLAGMIDVTGPFAVQVTASSGRIAAFARVRELGGDATQPGRGVDWEPAVATPATTAVVPDIPAGDGDRTLHVLNPSERMASVRYTFVSSDGESETSAPLTISPRGVAAVPLGTLARARAGSVVLRSDQGVVASVHARNGDGDFLLSSAQRPFQGTSVLPIPTQPGAATLQLTALESADVTVTVSDAAGQQLGQRIEQHLAGPTTFALPLPGADQAVVTVTVASGEAYGGVVATADTGGLAGLTHYPLVPGDGTRTGVGPVDTSIPR